MQAALDALPLWVVSEMQNVSVVVERRATRDQDPEGAGILGIYEGVPLSERGIDYFGVAPDRITIFYDHHIALDLSDDDLNIEIRVTVLHEIGHHLGLDDPRLHELGWS